MDTVDILAEELFFRMASYLAKIKLLNGTPPLEYRKQLQHDVEEYIEYFATRLFKEPEAQAYYTAWLRAEDRFDELYERLPYKKVFHETYSLDVFKKTKEFGEFNDLFDIYPN